MFALLESVRNFATKPIRHYPSHLGMLLRYLGKLFSNEDKILIQSLYLKGYTAKTLTDEFPEKSWTKRGVKLLIKLWDTEPPNDTTQHGSFQSHRNFIEENSDTVTFVC